MNYEAILKEYTMKDILEFNDFCEEDMLRYLVETGYLDLPERLPVDHV